MAGLLTPKPFRGDVIAAGVVVLVTLVWTLLVRFDDVWLPGAHLAYSAVALAFVGTLAVRAPMEGEAPRAYQSVLYLATLALWFPTLSALFELIGADGSAASVAGGALVALMAFAFAIERNSAACTLIGALAGGIMVLSLVTWAFEPRDVTAYRWTLVAVAALCGIGAVGLRDRHPRHGVALINVAGLAILAISGTLVLEGGWYGPSDVPIDVGDYQVRAVGWGWELLILAAGFGLIAYSSVDRQPGPAYLGVLNLVAFTLVSALSSDLFHRSLIGWPLVLAVAAVALLVVGLRPTTPAPPPPDVDAPEPPPLPLR